MGYPRRASLSTRVPTWCVKPCLKLCVEEVPDNAAVVLILCQPAATGKGHALSKRWSIHLYPVYEPARGLACRRRESQRETEPIESMYRYGFLGMSSETPSSLPSSSSQSSTSLVAPFPDSVVKTTLIKMCTWLKLHPTPGWTSVGRRAAAAGGGSCHCWSWRSTERR